MLRIRRAQASIDMILVMAVFLLLFLFLFQFLVRDRSAERVAEEVRLSALEEGQRVYFASTEVYLAGNGSSTGFYLPSSLIRNVPYTLRVYDTGFVVVSYQNRSTSFALPMKALNQTILSPGYHLVQNMNGVVSYV